MTIQLPRNNEERNTIVNQLITEAKTANATILDLGGLGLTVIPEQIKDLPQLTHLYLGAHKTVREKPYSKRTDNDKKLRNAVREVSAPLLKSLPHLTHLDLEGNEIGYDGAKAIASLTNLTNLDLRYNQIGYDGAKAIASLTNLTKLNLSSNQIGADGAKAIANSLTNLTHLDLQSNQIGDDGPKPLPASQTSQLFI